MYDEGDAYIEIKGFHTVGWWFSTIFQVKQHSTPTSTFFNNGLGQDALSANETSSTMSEKEADLKGKISTLTDESFLRLKDISNLSMYFKIITGPIEQRWLKFYLDNIAHCFPIQFCL